MQRSKLVLGFVVALGVGGLGAAAVAMENEAGSTNRLAGATTTTIEVDPTTTVPTTTVPVAPSASTDPTATPTADPKDGTDGTDPGVDRSTDGCDGGTYLNHGDYVSSIAHDPNRQPGDVAAAAQSDCAKPLSSVDGTDDAEPEAPEAPEAPESSAPESDDDGPSGNPGQGQGQGKGLGEGQD